MKATLEMLAAIYKASMILVTADDNPKQESLQPLIDFFYNIEGFHEEMLKMAVQHSEEQLDIEQVVDIISQFDEDAKQQFIDTLVQIACSNGEITPNETKVLNALMKMCELPSPSILKTKEEYQNDIEPTFIIARTNGLARPFATSDEDWRALDEALAAQIGAERLEVVRFTAPLNALSTHIGLNDYHLIFLVDRNSYTKSNIGDNMTGTLLYGSGQEILGDIIFALESDNGYKITGIRSSQLLNKIYSSINETVGGLLRPE